MTNISEDGRDPLGQALVQAPSPAVSALTGFDPSRSKRPSMAVRLCEFEAAVFDVRWIAERVMGGQQFNAWERRSNDPEGDPEDWDYTIGIGPVGDIRSICDVTGQETANLIEAALKVATEAMLERPDCDSDARPKDGDDFSAPLASSAAIAHD